MHGDQAAVLAFVKERIQRDVRANTARRARDRADLQNLQMYRGGEDNHWTVWDPQEQNYVPRPTGADDDAALPAWFFRATDNLFATKIDGICAILNQSQPAQEIGPQRDDDRDRAAADIAEKALPRLYDEIGYDHLRAQLHKLIALTNAAAVHVYYDTDERHGVDELPVLQCQACQDFALPHEVDDDRTCPACQQPGTMADAYHPPGSPMAGFPVTAPFPKGKLCARLLSSFEFSLPRSSRELHDERVPWIAAHGRMDPQELAALYPAAKAYVDPENRNRASGANSQSVQYADRMHAMSAPMATGDQRSAVGAANTNPAGPVVWMVWADPVDDDTYYFPEGLFAVIVDEAHVLECGPLPLKDDQGKPVKNVLIRTFASTPGSAWGKPPGDDLTPLQKQLNLCLALGFLILMNEAAPTTYIPDTVTLLDELSGSPGSVVRFKSMRAGDKPFIAGGNGFPESLKWFIEFLVGQFDTVSKLNAVLMGSRPQGGDPTAFEVQVLQERGMAAFKEPLAALVDFEKRLSKVLLWTARQSMWSPRFYTVAGENGEWQVRQFLGADLDGNVNIHVEPASAWPTSQLLQNMRLDQAIERGIINPADPEVQAAYLSLNDLAAFKQSVDEDRAQVARQLDVWRKAQSPMEIGQPDPLWNLPFHFFHKVQWLKTEEAETMAQQRPDIYAAIRQHIAGIQTLMMPPAPAPQPGTPGGGPPTGEAVSAAVQSGALQPKGEPSGEALSAAVHSGALRPGETPDGVPTR